VGVGALGGSAAGAGAVLWWDPDHQVCPVQKYGRRRFWQPLRGGGRQRNADSNVVGLAALGAKLAHALAAPPLPRGDLSEHLFNKDAGL
jgi:hypothetical protein